MLTRVKTTIAFEDKKTAIFIFCLFFSVLLSAKEISSDTVTTEKKAANIGAINKEDQKKPSTEAAEEGNVETTKDKQTTTSKKSTANVVIQAPTNQFKQRLQDIKYYLEKDDYHNINIDNEHYIFLIDPYTTSINKGVIILIPDWQTPFTGNSLFGELRKQLPQKSWTTITIMPPEAPKEYPSQAFDDEERLTRNSNDFINYQEKLTKLLTQLIEKTTQFPGPISIVAQGQQAAFISKIIHDKKLDKPAAFIMLSAYNTNEIAIKTLNESLAISQYPVLDLYLKKDNNIVLNNAAKRQQLAKNALKVEYRQKQLYNAVVTQYPNNKVSTEIIGWLTSLGW